MSRRSRAAGAGSLCRERVPDALRVGRGVHRRDRDPTRSAELFGVHDNIRALVRFADEELKHQALFARYREAFDASLGRPARALETASEVAAVVMSRSAIGGMPVSLHIALMTLDHYTESVRYDDSTPCANVA